MHELNSSFVNLFYPNWFVCEQTSAFMNQQNFHLDCNILYVYIKYWKISIIAYKAATHVSVNLKPQGFVFQETITSLNLLNEKYVLYSMGFHQFIDFTTDLVKFNLNYFLCQGPPYKISANQDSLILIKYILYNVGCLKGELRFLRNLIKKL